tara:strand:- start:31 stop:204 length:174 start_codon:yes stop_codon:yes gene_type:complete
MKNQEIATALLNDRILMLTDKQAMDFDDWLYDNESALDIDELRMEAIEQGIKEIWLA